MREPRGAAVRAELAGWGIALALSVGVVALVATRSADLLFTDGDSLVVAMIARSLAEGQPQDWAMSPVLFLPEVGVYAVLALLGLGMPGTLVLNGVVNLLALYGALRVAAGRRGRASTPVLGAVVAFTVFAILAAIEGPATRSGAQFGALATTTTYYAATVIASVLTVGLVRRVIDRGTPRGAVAPLVAIVLVAGVSTLSNPLFAAWVVLPVVVVVSILALRRGIPPLAAVATVTAPVVGAVAGLAARSAFAHVIVATDANYLHIGEISRSADAYARVLWDVLARPTGLLWLAAVLGLWVFAGVVAARAHRAGLRGVAVVAGVAVVGPVLVTAGAFALGADAARYLQPWLFLPLAAVAAAPAVVRVRLPAWARRRAGGIVLAGAVLIAAVGVPVAGVAATRTDTDLDCVTSWIEASGRTGAGQYWTVRAPKAHLDDPAQLVQVDHTLRVYTWLTNRAEQHADAVTFLIVDAASPAFVLPQDAARAVVTPVPCGRYLIRDFGAHALPLGPPRA